MKIIRINQLITHQMKVEEDLKKSTSFQDYRKLQAIHSFNVMFFENLEREKQSNFEKLKS